MRKIVFWLLATVEGRSNVEFEAREAERCLEDTLARPQTAPLRARNLLERARTVTPGPNSGPKSRSGHQRERRAFDFWVH